MKKILFFLLGIICILSTVHSQQLSPSVIAAQGGISKAAGIALEWTLGEPFTESLPVSNGLYTQGFHQPLLQVIQISKTLTKQVAGYAKTVTKPVTNYKITVVPNPVQSYLTASITAPNSDKIIVSLIDFAGRVIPVRFASGIFSTVRVDMTGMIAGIYMLEMRKATGELIQTFKIIKGQ